MKLSNPQRILIIGPSWVGDMVMAQSLFKLLKMQHPGAELHVLAPAWTFSLLSCMPEVSVAIEMPFAHGEIKLIERYRFAKTLRRSHYALAIVLPNSFKSALIPWFAGISKRRGWLGEQRYILLNDYRYLDKKQYPYMVEQYLALGLSAGARLPEPYPVPSFNVSHDERMATLLKHQPLWRGKPILAMAAGCEFGSSKRWLPQYFAQVAKDKMKEGWDIWLFGSKKDKVITDEIMLLTDGACENLAGRLQLFETIHLLSLSYGLITNDSGLMHVAAALNKPLIAIYGSTSPAFTPPLSANAQILKRDLDCQPCFQRECPLKHHRCMREITPPLVLNAIARWSH